MNTPEERSLSAAIAAHSSWAHTSDRAARTAAARAGLDAKFLREAEGDPVRAEHARKAHFMSLALKSAKSRRLAAEARAAAEAAEQEMLDSGYPAERDLAALNRVLDGL